MADLSIIDLMESNLKGEGQPQSPDHLAFLLKQRVGSMHLIEYKTGRLRTLILFKYSKLSNMIFGHVNNFMHPFRTELSELCG